MPKQKFVDIVRDGYEGRPGPIFLEFCLDVQGMPPIAESAIEDSKSSNPVISDAQLSEITNKLKSSQRPLLMIGGGVSRTTATQLQSQFARAGIPIVTTWNGADRISAENSLFLGRPNTWGQRGPNLLVAQADLLIAVGTRLGMQQTGFNWQEFGRNAFIVHVDIDTAELEKGHPRTDIKLAVDANDFLTRLLVEEYPSWDEWLSYGHEVLDLLPLDDPENETAPGFVSPYDFYTDLSKLATNNDIIIPCSSGGANSTSMQTIQQKLGQVVITDKGLASMGYGLSGAIGAALAHPGRRTFLVEGDGGFAQNLQELATVAVNNLPIKTFIFANNGYGSIRMTQKNYFGGAYLGCDTETGLGFPDWQLLFRSFGIPCMTIDQDWATDPKVLYALNSESAYGFIVPIDPLQTYWPKITSRIVEGGGMESNPLHMMSPDLSPELFAKVTRFL
jgi:acetolactate synthase-1/2/3 large subunit